MTTRKIFSAAVLIAAGWISTAAEAAGETEPNDSCTTAQGVGSVPTKAVSASIGSGDIDYYKLSGEPASFITISVDNQPSGAATTLASKLLAYNSSCVKLAESTSSSKPAQTRLLVQMPADGKLRFSVVALSGSTGSYVVVAAKPVGIYGQITQQGSAAIPHISYPSFAPCLDPQYSFCNPGYSSSSPMLVDFVNSSFLIDTSSLPTGRYQLAIRGYTAAGVDLAVWHSPPLDLKSGQTLQLYPALEPMPAQLAGIRNCGQILGGGSCDLEYSVLNTTDEPLDLELRASSQVQAGGEIYESVFDTGGKKGGTQALLKSVAAGQKIDVKQSLAIPSDVPSGSVGLVTIYAYRQGQPERAIGELEIVRYVVQPGGSATISAPRATPRDESDGRNE